MVHPTSPRGRSVILNFLDTLEFAYPQYKFSLYFENFFTSDKLLDEIRKTGHDNTGTIWSNRLEKYPLTDSKQFKKQARGSEEYCVEK